MASPPKSDGKDVIRRIALDLIDPSVENRPDRSGMDHKSLSELAASICQQGIVQPLVVRPNPRDKSGKRFELVVGERRWTAASLKGIPADLIKSLGLVKQTDVPCIVRELSDNEAREVRIIENLQRVDVHPIEEAKGMQALLDEVEELPKEAASGKERTGTMTAGLPAKKYTVETLAQKLGKSPTAIYARLKLLRMPPFAQDAMFKGKLNASVALLLCRIPDPKLAHKASLEVLDPYGQATDPKREERALDPAIEPMSFRAAKAHIQNKYMVRLHQTPFDPEDETLVPVQVDFGELPYPAMKALPPAVPGGPPGCRMFGGKCSDCPWRTGNMKTLFPDGIDATDLCTNPSCFKKKKDATFKRSADKYKEKGQTLLTPGKTQQLIDTYEGKLSSQARAEFVDLKEQVPGKRGKTYEDVITEHLPQDADILVAKAGKKTHLLVPVEQAIAAAKKAGLTIEKPKVEEDYQQRQKRENEERSANEARATAVLKVVSPLLNQAVAKAKPEHALRFAVHQFAGRHEADEDLTPKAIDKAKLPQLIQILVNVATGDTTTWRGQWTESFQAACGHFGIDLKKHCADHDKAAKEAAAKEAAAKKDEPKSEKK